MIPKEFSGILQLLRINTAYYFPQSCAESAENPQRSLRDEKLFVQLNSFKQTTSITNYLFHLIPQEFLRFFCGFCATLREIKTGSFFPQTCAEDAENPQRSLRDEKLFVQLNSFKQTTSITNYLFHLIPQEFLRFFCGFCATLREIKTGSYFPQSCAESAENPQISLRDEKLFVQLNSFKQTTSITNYLFHLIPQEFLRFFCGFCATLREIKTGSYFPYITLYRPERKINPWLQS